MAIKAHYTRRNSEGRYSRNGKYYATSAGLRVLPQFRGKVPEVPDRRLVPPAAPPAPAAPAPTPGAPAAPVPPPRAGERLGRNVRKVTMFRAAGSMETGYTFADSYKRGLLDEDLENEAEGFAVPALFFSNQGHLFGQVNFDGEIPLSDLIARLNAKLQFLGEESDDFDFRKVYLKWEYHYKVFEKRGTVEDTIAERRDSRG